MIGKVATQQGHFYGLDNIHVFICIWIYLKNSLPFVLTHHNHRMA